MTGTSLLLGVGKQSSVISLPSIPVSPHWWLQGGVNENNCVAAYQGTGAESEAESLINLANPGTYNLRYVSSSHPEWTTTNGWRTWDTNVAFYTDIVPVLDHTWSMIARFHNARQAEYVPICGMYQTSSPYHGFALGAYWGGTVAMWINGTDAFASPNITTGVLAVAGNKCYRNKVHEATISSTSTATLPSIRLLGFNDNSLDGYLDAVAIYKNAPLTETQVGLITDAMNEL